MKFSAEHQLIEYPPRAPQPRAARLAAIDVGSNSLRLVVAEVLPSGAYRVLDEERQSTRLAKSLAMTGRLDPARMDESLRVLSHFKKIADGFAVSELRAIATCAVREAANGEEFCRRAHSEAGLEIEVISPTTEAQLAFLSVQRAFDISDRRVAVADIGGGSTEIVLASGDHIEAIYSTPLGAVRMSEMAGASDRLVGRDYARLIAHIEDELQQSLRKPPFLPHVLFGTGGTFTNLARMVMAADGHPGQPVWGHRLTRSALRHLLDRLRNMPLKARRNVPGLSAHRADIIVAGLAVIDRIMCNLRVNVLQVHSRGVRDGLLLTMVDEVVGQARKPCDRDAALTDFAQSCGVDMAHARHVAGIAEMLFDQLAGPFRLNPHDRVLLQTAALLEDVGYLINFEQHHKHSYHLIVNSQLAGFDQQELQLIASIARYHRGANPKKRHVQFRKLTADQQRRVRQLAAILRLAGGLDRSHAQHVRLVKARVVGGTTHIEVESQGDGDVDVWAARQRAALFEKAFDSKVQILRFTGFSSSCHESFT